VYSRPLYAGLVALAVGSLQVAAAFGSQLHYYAAFLAAVALGAVVFHQGEGRVVAGPIVSNFGAGVVLGNFGGVFVTGGLLIWILNVPWDLAMWQAGVLSWGVAIGLDFALVTSFFLVGVADAMN